MNGLGEACGCIGASDGSLGPRVSVLRKTSVEHLLMWEQLIFGEKEQNWKEEGCYKRLILKFEMKSEFQNIDRHTQEEVALSADREHHTAN